MASAGRGVSSHEGGRRQSVAVCGIPEPDRAIKCLVALCFYRFDLGVGQIIKQNLNFYATKPSGPALIGWFLATMMQIEDKPEAFPFCLSEREFVYYSKENFGEDVENAEGIYHPPDFYGSLVKFSIGLLLGVAAAGAVSSVLPEAAIGAAAISKFAPDLARAATGQVTGLVIGHVLGGDPIDAYEKTDRWKRYKLDLQRRTLR